jgi:hypothetical protein
MEWTYLDSDRDLGRGLVNTVINLAFHERQRILWSAEYHHFMKQPARPTINYILYGNLN